MTTPVTCLHCGNDFVPRRQQKFCSRDCAMEYHRQIADPTRARYCVGCGKEYRLSRNKPQKYCSIKCRDKYAHSNRAKRYTDYVCEHCGETYKLHCYSKPTRYCSMKCFGAAKSIADTFSCVMCGKEYKVKPSQVLRTGTRFCSRRCKGDWMSKHLSGANNPKFNGGEPGYRGTSWYVQRKKALKRDGGKCQICKRPKSKRLKIQVHHIKPYRLFDGDHVAANQLDNLITLCHKCHPKVECGKLPCPRPLL